MTKFWIHCGGQRLHCGGCAPPPVNMLEEALLFCICIILPQVMTGLQIFFFYKTIDSNILFLSFVKIFKMIFQGQIIFYLSLDERNTLKVWADGKQCSNNDVLLVFMMCSHLQGSCQFWHSYNHFSHPLFVFQLAYQTKSDAFHFSCFQSLPKS